MSAVRVSGDMLAWPADGPVATGSEDWLAVERVAHTCGYGRQFWRIVPMVDHITGATSLIPVASQPWGDRYGIL
jgi:hypothetical protein